MNHSNELNPATQMMQMITGFWTSCCIYVAAKLDLADHIVKRPQSAEQLAQIINCHPPSLRRLLRALSGAGLFIENENGIFHITALGKTLSADIEGSMKAYVLTQLGDHYLAWGNLLYSVRTGNIAFDNKYGMNIWKYYESHPEEGINFMKAMTGLTATANQYIIPAYDFSKFHTIIDVGGGNGSLLMAVLDAAPDSKGIVFDEDYVVLQTRKTLENKGFSERCQAVGGNFFEKIPGNGDLYLIKKVLHDWDDEKCMQILKACHDAMGKESRLLVIETVLPQGNSPHPGKLQDINMMVMTGGMERTKMEFDQLFLASGMKLKAMHKTGSVSLDILEVVKQN